MNDEFLVMNFELAPSFPQCIEVERWANSKFKIQNLEFEQVRR